MTEHLTDLNQIIQFRLAEIAEKNPQFSLRALAKKLKLSPSHLSRVLRGKKKFSYQSTLRLARELDLSPSQTEKILLAFHQSKLKKGEAPSPSHQDKRNSKILEFEVFRVISDWYHFPILELIRTRGFRSDENWIANRLSLPLPQVSTALQRLEKLGLIARSQGRIALAETEMLKTSDDIKSIAIRKHHAQMLQKATEALENQDPLEREFQGLNLNFNPEDLESAKKAIREFTKSFNKKFSRKNGDEVFQMNIQFFPLTKESQ